MKPTWCAWSALVLGVAASPLAAQGATWDPILVFTISGGLSSGSNLWSVPNQEQPVLGSSPLSYDTVSLARQMRPGLVAGLSGAYYISPHFGLTGDVGYFGLGTEQRCVGPATYRDTVITRQACNRANGSRVATSIVGFMAGGTYRFNHTGTLQPYVRLTAGLGLVGNSFVETSTTITWTGCGTPSNTCNFAFYTEDVKRTATYLVNLEGGVSIFLSPAYRFRFQARDIITSVPVVSGARNPTGGLTPPTEMRMKHVPVIQFGFDVILERSRARRY